MVLERVVEVDIKVDVVVEQNDGVTTFARRTRHLREIHQLNQHRVIKLL